MSTSSKFKKHLTWISLLSAAGAAISIWQTRLFHVTRSGMGDGHSFCNIGQTFDCTAIEMSPYSEILKGIPLSGVAISGYLVLLILALYGFSEVLRVGIRKLLIVFSSIALLFSIGYLIIMMGVIGKLCLLCLGVDVINLVIFVLAITLPKQQEGELPPQTPILTQLIGTGIGSLVVAFMLVKATNPQDGMKRADLNDMIESVMATPATPISLPADVPVIGNPDAPVTIIKFSDYQCPACRMASNSIHPLMKRYPNEVKFAFVNFPLDMGCNPLIKNKMHEYACEAAAVAICAHKQGKFEEAYTLLFEKQAEFDFGKIADLLATIPGIDLNQLKECTTQPSTMDKIKNDVTLSENSKIRSTPTFFVNGKKVEGGLPTNLWIEVIDQLLKK